MALDKDDPFGFDVLFCEESIENDEFVEEERSQNFDQTPSTNPVSLFVGEDPWDDSELQSLLSKEKDAHFEGILDGSLLECRRAAVTWISTVRAHYGFAPLTGVLAVNYFDRFIATPMFQRDKPWMCQLTAVACISLAAKVEEPFVPLLVDLQVSVLVSLFQCNHGRLLWFQVVDSKFFFEAKTIKRMEIVVLSSLKWRMHPVTAISFFNHFASRIHLSCRLEFLGLCERILLSFVSDFRVTMFVPSVTAAAIMLAAAKEMNLGCYDRMFGELKVDERKLDRCCELVEETLEMNNGGPKKHKCCVPMSPDAVIDGLCGSDSSIDSWSLQWSPSPLPAKKRKLKDQLMR